METLTQRELQVADLIHRGFIEKEIADQLFLSPGTIHTYKKRLCQKLGARNIADITRIYILDLKRPLVIIVMFFALALQILSMIADTSDMIRPLRTRIAASLRGFSKTTGKSFRYKP
jgi:DNA-binding CsgD family transcriptional regulator